MKPYILGAIFARGGSKGIPRKNIRILNGKPLIAYAIEVGLSVSLIDKLIVSTDDEEIASVARKYGVEIPFMRPATLAQDNSPELLAWKHAVETYEKLSKQKVDVMVSLPPTSPLRKTVDVELCIKKLLDSDADVVITVRDAERNPYFNMVTLDAKQNARLVIKPKKIVNNRQRAPEVFDIATVAYAVRAEFIKKARSLFDGKVKAVKIPRERSIDIDTMLDFELAEFFLKKGDRTHTPGVWAG